MQECWPAPGDSQSEAGKRSEYMRGDGAEARRGGIGSGAVAQLNLSDAPRALKQLGKASWKFPQTFTSPLKKLHNAATPPAITLSIARSHNIVLNNLIIEGGAPPLYVSDSSSATLVQNCTVQNTTADGLDIDAHSELTIQNSGEIVDPEGEISRPTRIVF